MQITESFLKQHGFKWIDLHDEAPYEMWEKCGVEIWNFNGQYWLVDALDQAGIHVGFTTVGQLAAFFRGCKLNLYA